MCSLDRQITYLSINLILLANLGFIIKHIRPSTVPNFQIAIKSQSLEVPVILFHQMELGAMSTKITFTAQMDLAGFCDEMDSKMMCFRVENEDYCEMTLKLGQGHQRSNFCLTIRVVPFLSHNIADTLFTCIDYIKHNIKFKMNKNVHF